PEKPTFAMDMLMMPPVQETDPTGIAYKIENAYDSDGTWRGERLQTTDWMGEVLRRGHIANQEVSVRGGTDKLKTYSSVTYFDQQGLVYTQDFSRYVIRTNF